MLLGNTDVFPMHMQYKLIKSRNLIMLIGTFIILVVNCVNTYIVDIALENVAKMWHLAETWQSY